FAAQGRKIHPGAGRELEVLSDTTVENQPLVQPPKLGEANGVADAVIALLVKGLGGFLGVPPIARSDVRSLEAQLELFDISDQLDAHPRRRKADMTCLGDRPGGGEGKRRRLGRSVTGNDQDALAGLSPRCMIEPVENMLCQP